MALGKHTLGPCFVLTVLSCGAMPVLSQECFHQLRWVGPVTKAREVSGNLEPIRTLLMGFPKPVVTY